MRAGTAAPAPSRISTGGARVVLALSLGAASFGFVAAVVLSRSDTSTRVQWVLFLASLGFAAAAAFGGPRIWQRLDRDLGPDAASALTGGLAAGLALAALLARLAAEAVDAAPALAVTLGLWLLVAAGSVRWSLRLPRIRLSSRTDAAWIVAGALGALIVLAYTGLGSISPTPLVALLVSAFGVAALHRRAPWLPARFGPVLDGVVVLVAGLACIDLIAYQGGGIPTLLNFQVHQTFLLGPANDVLGGRVVLVDTFCQYGIGSVYALAAWFSVAPIGYGTLSLLNGLLLAAAWGLAFAILRLAGCGRLVSAAAVGVGVFVTAVSVFAPASIWPQIGPLRFGMPLLVLVAETAGSRRPGLSGRMRAASFVVLGVSSIWSIEALVYTAATLGAIILTELAGAKSLRAGGRRLARQVGVAAGTCAVAQVLLVVVTLALSGELPRWGAYLEYFRIYMNGYTSPAYLFGEWSAGLAVGALYVGSAVSAIVLIRDRPHLVRGPQAPALVAIVGTTAYGLSTFTYVVGRAVSLPYAALPAFLLGGLWVGYLLATAGRRGRYAAAGGAAWIAILLVSVGWSASEPGLSRTALAKLMPGGRGNIVDATKALWSSPPVDPRAPEGQRLIDEAIPGSGPVLVLTTSDLSTEILVRLERINRLPLGDPAQTDLLRSRIAPQIEEAVDELDPGTRMLLDPALVDTLPEDPLDGPPTVVVDLGPVALQYYALQLILQRFDLRTVDRGDYGLEVVELIPK